MVNVIRESPVGLAVAIAGLVVVGWLWPSSAAAVGSSCDTSGEATFNFDDPGTALRASAGFKAGPGAADDEVGVVAKGTDANGDPAGGSSTCGATDSWHLITMNLGDRGDRGRLDAIKPRALDLGPVPETIEVVMDGGGGADTLTGHAGPDTLQGGGGGDTLSAADGDPDTVNCGPGRDQATVDRHKDTRTGCEDVAFG